MSCDMRLVCPSSVIVQTLSACFPALRPTISRGSSLIYLEFCDGVAMVGVGLRKTVSHVIACIPLLYLKHHIGVGRTSVAENGGGMAFGARWRPISYNIFFFVRMNNTNCRWNIRGWRVNRHYPREMLGETKFF
jgi:hypothetical protein